MDAIFTQIKNGFSRVHKDELISGRKKWTQAFFDELMRIGINNDYKVYSSSTSEPISEKEGGGEWLFDLCWTMEGNDWMSDFKGLKLICESEWLINEEEIIYDFQKLAVVKAECKIMIIQFNNETQFIQFKQKCINSISHYLLFDESTYVLVGSGNSEEDIRFDILNGI